MPAPKIFVDTNILVYAHDTTAGRKREIAKAAILDLWNSETGVLSTQVLQEVYVSLTQKIPAPLDGKNARAILEDLCAWKVMVNDEQAVLAAIDLQVQYRLSFWDSLILEAARRSGATMLYSEDLSHGQQVDGIKIVNPFNT